MLDFGLQPLRYHRVTIFGPHLDASQKRIDHEDFFVCFFPPFMELR